MQQASIATSGTPAERQLPLKLAADRVVRLLLGPHPWPQTGWVGRGTQLVLLVGALAYLVVEAPTGGWRQQAERFFGNDLVAYLTGSALIASGQARDLYTPSSQLAAQQALMASVGSDTLGMEYVNPPLWAAVMAVLLPVGVMAADWLWRIVILAGSLATLLWVGRAFEPGRGWWRAAMLMLCVFPFVQGWHHRSMVVLVILAFGGWMALRRLGRPFAAGLVLSLMLLKPQYLVFPGVYLLWRREWRTVAGLAAGGALQLLLTLLLFVPSGGIGSLESILPFAGVSGSTTSGAMAETHVNIRGALLNLVPGLPPAVLLTTLAALTLAVTAAALAALPSGAVARAAEWELLAVAALTNLLAPYNHITGLVLLLPPALLLLTTSGPNRLDGRLATISVLLALPTLGFVLATLNPALYVGAAWLTVLGCAALGIHQARSASVNVVPASPVAA